MENNFAGIITGASTGIGKDLAIQLAKKYKARLVLNARGASALNDTAAQVREAGGQAILIAGDISQNSLATKLVDICLESFGGVDLLVNNAGLTKPGKFINLTAEDWKTVFAINFFAPLESTYKALPYMLKKGKGKIVNVSSVAGKVIFPGSTCYSSSKFALTGMSEGIAAELASENIDVITVCPGWVRTEFFSKNKMTDNHNPTKIASRATFQGWLMRNVLSISSEACAAKIIQALEKGGSREIILTLPGVLIERINALFPGLLPPVVSRLRI